MKLMLAVLKSTVFCILAVIASLEYIVPVYEQYKSKDTQFVVKSIKKDDHRLPPIFICTDYGLKPTVLAKYRVPDPHNLPVTEFNGTSIWDFFMEASYLLNRDFEMLIGWLNFNSVKLKRGRNLLPGSKNFFDVKEIHSQHGTCYEVRTDINLTRFSLITATVTMDPNLEEINMPEGINVATEFVWVPKFAYIPFGKGNNKGVISLTHKETNSLNGNIESMTPQQCLPWSKIKEKTKDCPRLCLPVILHWLYPNQAEQCKEPLEHDCMMNFIPLEQLTETTQTCLKAKRKKTYEVNLRLLKSVDVTKKLARSVQILFYNDDELKVVSNEILIFDIANLIGTAGGLLSLFLGFSFFSIFCDALDFFKLKFC